MDMRLLDIEEREERAEATDDGEGEADRGVEMSDELEELKGYDAIDITGACVGGSGAEKKEEAECGNGTSRNEETWVSVEAAEVNEEEDSEKKQVQAQMRKRSSPASGKAQESNLEYGESVE
nr:uncharacterized protein CTRU02_10825 [Colletotrichum truncatum]KAF6786701.1 hypothetical protein CTRU02_10825 [Colletotrichum truncatum]